MFPSSAGQSWSIEECPSPTTVRLWPLSLVRHAHPCTGHLDRKVLEGRQSEATVARVHPTARQKMIRRKKALECGLLHVSQGVGLDCLLSAARSTADIGTKVMASEKRKSCICLHEATDGFGRALVVNLERGGRGARPPCLLPWGGGLIRRRALSSEQWLAMSSNRGSHVDVSRPRTVTPVASPADGRMTDSQNSRRPETR